MTFSKCLIRERLIILMKLGKLDEKEIDMITEMLINVNLSNYLKLLSHGG